MYRKTSNISRTLVGNKIVDNSDVVGASPVGAAPTTSSFSTQPQASMHWAKTAARRYKKHLSLRFGATYTRGFTVAHCGYIFTASLYLTAPTYERNKLNLPLLCA